MAHRSVRSFFKCHVALAGYGPQKLATLAAYALRRNLLDWLETFKVEKLCAARLAKQREAAKVCPLHQLSYGCPCTACAPLRYIVQQACNSCGVTAASSWLAVSSGLQRGPRMAKEWVPTVSGVYTCRGRSQRRSTGAACRALVV